MIVYIIKVSKIRPPFCDTGNITTKLQRIMADIKEMHYFTHKVA